MPLAKSSSKTASAEVEKDPTDPDEVTESGIADGGNIDEGYRRNAPEDSVVSVDGLPVSPAQYTKNHWIETERHWIYWKVKAAKGEVIPSSIRAPGGPKKEELSGDREYRPTFVGSEDEKLVFVLSLIHISEPTRPY